MKSMLVTLLVLSSFSVFSANYSCNDADGNKLQNDYNNIINQSNKCNQEFATLNASYDDFFNQPDLNLFGLDKPQTEAEKHKSALIIARLDIEAYKERTGEYDQLLKQLILNSRASNSLVDNDISSFLPGYHEFADDCDDESAFKTVSDKLIKMGNRLYQNVWKEKSMIQFLQGEIAFRKKIETEVSKTKR